MDDEMPQAAPAEVPKRHGAKRAADSSADESQPSGAKLNTKTLSNRKGPVRARRASRISAAAVAKAVNSDDDVVEREAAPTKRLKAAACTPVSDDSDDDVIERVAPKKRRKAVARTTVSDDIDDDVVERKAPKRRKAAARALVIEDDDENKDDGGDEEAGDTDEISSDGKADGDHVESGGAGGGASAAKTTAVAAGKKIVTGKVVKRKVVKKFAKWFSWPSDYETLPELNEDVWKEVCSFVDPIDVAHLVHGGGSYFDVLAPPRVWAGALAQRFPHGVTLMENEKFAAAYCALVHGLCRFCYKSLDGEQTKNHGGVAASLPFFSPKSGLAILGKGAQWKTAAAAAKKKGSMGSAGAGAGGDEAQEEDVTEAGAIEGETPDECLRRRLLAPASSTSRYGRRFMAPPVAEPQPEVPLVGLKAWQLAAREADAKEAARGPVAARFFEERRDAWFLKSSIEDRQQIRNKSRWEPITGVEALWRTQDSLLKSGGEVPPVSFRRSSGKPWGGMYPGPSPPIHCCAKCRRDTDICMGLKQAERQFGLGKNSLLSADVPIAEGKSMFSNLSRTQAPGRRYVLTSYADKLAFDLYKGDTDKMATAAESLIKSKRREGEGKRVEAKAKRDLGVDWAQMHILRNPSSSIFRRAVTVPAAPGVAAVDAGAGAGASAGAGVGAGAGGDVPARVATRTVYLIPDEYAAWLISYRPPAGVDVAALLPGFVPGRGCFHSAIAGQEPPFQSPDEAAQYARLTASLRNPWRGGFGAGPRGANDDHDHYDDGEDEDEYGGCG